MVQFGRRHTSLFLCRCRIAGQHGSLRGGRRFHARIAKRATSLSDLPRRLARRWHGIHDFALAVLVRRRKLRRSDQASNGNGSLGAGSLRKLVGDLSGCLVHGRRTRCCNWSGVSRRTGRSGLDGCIYWRPHGTTNRGDSLCRFLGGCLDVAWLPFGLTRGWLESKCRSKA